MVYMANYPHIYNFKRTDFILEIMKLTSHINIIKVCVVSTQMSNSKMKRCSYQSFPYNKLTWLPRILNIKGTVPTWKREQQLFRKKKWGIQNKNKQKATVLGHIRGLPPTTEMLFMSPAYFLCKGSHIFVKHTLKHA